MPELFFKVSVTGGKAAIQELNSLDSAYQKVGVSSTKNFQAAEKAASTFGHSLHEIKNIAIGMAASMGAMDLAEQMREWVAAAIETEKQWANVTTLIDESRQYTDELYESLKKLGPEFGATAELARGMYMTLSANVPAEKSVQFVETAAKFAKAAVTDTFTAVDLLTTVINAYGMEVEEAMNVSDKLFQMVRKGKTTGDMLANSLGMVIPTAAALKVDLNELGAAFAAMTQSGISAHMATTGLNQAMITFLHPSKQATEKAKELGVTIDAAHLKSVGLAQALGELAAAAKKDDEAISMFFGNIRALRAALALTGEQAQTYKKLLDDMRNSQELTNIAFEKQVGTLGAQLEAFWTNLGKLFKSAFFSGHSMTGMLKSLNAQMSASGANFNALKTGLLAFSAAIGVIALPNLISWLGKGSTALLSFGGALTGAQAGLLALGAAVAAFSISKLVAAFGEMQTKWDQISRAQELFASEDWPKMREALRQMGVDFRSLSTDELIKLIDEFAVAGDKQEFLITKSEALGKQTVALTEDTKKLKQALEGMSDQTAKAGLLGSALAALREEYMKSVSGTESTAGALKGVTVNLKEQTTSLKANIDIVDTQKNALDKIVPAIIALKDVWEQSGVPIEGANKAFIDNIAALRKEVPAMQESRRGAEALTEAQKELMKAFEKGADPAKQWGENIRALMSHGKKAADIAMVFSKEITDAADSARLMGKSVEAIPANILEMAQAFERAKQKSKELQEDFKQLTKIIDTDLPQAIAALKNKELTPHAQDLVDAIAQAQYLSGAIKELGDAYAYATKYLEWFDDVLNKNKANLKKQMADYNELKGPFAALQKDYELLGATFNKSMKEMAAAWERRKGLMTDKAATDAMTTMVETAVQQMEKLPAAVAADLDKMVLSTDAAVRTRMIPIWMDYQRSIKDIQGQFAPTTVQTLMQVMQSTDIALKREMLPLWEEYIQSVKQKYGTLSPALDKLNQRVIKETDTTLDKMRDMWLQQVSTIVTDFSRGVADIIFEAKSMKEVVTDIFKEMGKMIVRTLLEVMFAPLKKMLEDLVKWIFDKLKTTTTKVADTATSIAQSLTQAVLPSAAGTGSYAATLGIGALESLKTPAPGEYGNILSQPEAAAGALPAAAGAAAGTAAAGTKGIFGLPKGGIKGQGIGGPVGQIMTMAGMMMALDSLRRQGAAGYAEGAAGGALAGLALGGWKGAMVGGGGMLMAKGWQGTGAGSWGASIGGGALAGAGIGTMILPGIGTAIGAAIGALVGAVGKVVQAIRGKSAELAGAIEAARDLGDIKISKDAFKEYYQGIGLSESTAYSIRKDIMMAPKFLVEIAAPAARAQGKMEDFLKSLEKVETKWGTFNFRQEFELGELTGDWEALDKAYQDAFEHSDMLQKNLPDWKEKLLMTGDAVKQTAADFQNLYKEWRKGGMISDEFVQFMDDNAEALNNAAKQSALFAKELDVARAAMEAWKSVKPIYQGFSNLKDALESLEPPIMDMYQRFAETGEISEELAAQITQYGGDIAKFQEVARLGKLNNYFESLVETFRETGQVLPDLRKMFQDFGGDLAVLDEAAKLPGLRQTLADIQDFSAGLNEILPELSPLQQILQGVWDKDTWARLQEMGFDPSKFVKITDLLKYEKGWDQAVDDFYNKTVKVWDETKQKYVDKWAGLQPGGLIEQALYKYGGEEGMLALKRYREQGINTISPAMLERLKGKIDEDFTSERSNVLDYLKTMQQSTQGEIDRITTAVEGEFTKVGDKLWAIFDKARSEVLDELGDILDKITEGVDLVAQQAAGTAAPSTVQAGATATSPRYYNESGGAYSNEQYSYWRTNGQWYQGTKGTNAISAIDQPPWRTPLTDGGESPGTRDRRVQIPIAQEGGRVASEGLAYIHGGELIIPSALVSTIEKMGAFIERENLSRMMERINDLMVVLPGRMPARETQDFSGTLERTITTLRNARRDEAMERALVPLRQQLETVVRQEGGGVTYEEHYHLEGATFYQGFDDFEERVARTWEARFDKGGFRKVARARG